MNERRVTERRGVDTADLRKRFEYVFMLGAGLGIMGGLAWGALLMLALRKFF